MVVISAELATALRTTGPDRIETWATLHNAATGVKTATVELKGGSVTQDAGAAWRTSCQLSLGSLDGLTPDELTTGTDRKFGDGSFGSGTFGDYRRRYLRGALLPLATEVRVHQRFLLPGTATWETIEQGRFIVQDPTFEDGPDGNGVSITGFDRSSAVASAAWTAPFKIAKNTNAGTALRALIQSRLPGATVITPSTAETTARLIYAPGGNVAGNPWQDAVDLAAVFGWELAVDRLGRFVATEATAALGASVWGLRDDTTAHRFEQTLAGSDLVNQALVFGESIDEKPVYAVATNTTGPYGTVALGRTVAREFRSSLVKTQAQAMNYAIRQLRAYGRIVDQVAVQCHPAPHLDVGDVVKVSSDVLELEAEKFQVEQITYDLDPQTATRVVCSREM